MLDFMWSPLGDRYLSALLVQRSTRSLRNRKVPVSNPPVGKNFILKFTFRTPLRSSKYMQMKSTMTYSELIPCFRKKGSQEKYCCRFQWYITFHVSFKVIFKPIIIRHVQLRFCHRSDGRYGFEKIFQAVLCPTQLFQWKLICTYNQHCLSYKISNRLQFNPSLFPHKLFNMLLHWHTFFQNVPHVENTFKYTNTYTYVFCWPV